MINCPSIKREYRNRGIYDNNTEERKLLYSNCKDEDGIILGKEIKRSSGMLWNIF